jgi:hypothetical protein
MSASKQQQGQAVLSQAIAAGNADAVLGYQFHPPLVLSGSVHFSSPAAAHFALLSLLFGLTLAGAPSTACKHIALCDICSDCLEGRSSFAAAQQRLQIQAVVNCCETELS